MAFPDANQHSVAGRFFARCAYGEAGQVRTVKFGFWVKVGVSAGLLGLAGLLLGSEQWQRMLFGFDPEGSILGPVIAVLIQGGVLAAILAAVSLRGGRAAHQEGDRRGTAPAVARRRSASEAQHLSASLCVGAFEVAANGPRE
jgi:hypothetical protein